MPKKGSVTQVDGKELMLNYGEIILHNRLAFLSS